MQVRGQQSHQRSMRPSLRALNRRGAITLEFILTLPLLIMIILALIEFSMMLRTGQQVAMASQFGAKLASEVTRNKGQVPNLNNFNTLISEANQVSLKNQIDGFLATHGLTGSCKVILEHNACGSVINSPQELPLLGSCPCESPTSPTFPLPGKAPPFDTSYVRVTVALPMAGNIPDLLSSLGFSLGDRTFQHTTTLRVEPRNTPPQVVIRNPQQPVVLLDFPPKSITVSPDIRTAPYTWEPPNPNVLTVTVPANTGNAATFWVTFGSLTSSDDQDVNLLLQKSWETDAENSVTIADQGLSAQFGVPPAGQQTRDYYVKLIVTDSCGAPAEHIVNVHVVRENP